VTTDLSGNEDQFNGLGLETVNGVTEMVAVGIAYTNRALARYNPNGTLDSTFGSGGVVIVPSQFQGSGPLAIQPDQKIVVYGNAPSLGVRAAARFNLDGSFDTTFNPNGTWPGIATIQNWPLPTSGGGSDLVVQPADGKIILGGRAGSSSGDYSALARLNPDGTVDTSLGSSGIATEPSSAGVLTGLALQAADGKIVTSNNAVDGSGNWYFGVARFLNGSPTTTTLASSANPSVYGQSVTFTATVSTTGTVSPTGTVQFLDGSTLLGTGTLSTANGITTATFATTTLAVGTHSLSAVYGGDGNDMGSTSAVLSQVVNATSSPAPVITATRPAMPTTIAPSGRGPFIVPLVLDSPDLWDGLGFKRRSRGA
jgi:uncharacterized delta-60 repeat protein